MARKQRQPEADPNTLEFRSAWSELAGHPLFAPMTERDYPRPEVTVTMIDRPMTALSRVSVDGRVTVSRARRLAKEEWR
jgi:hypothetical protein